MPFEYYFLFNALHGGGFFRNLRIYPQLSDPGNAGEEREEF